MSPEQILQRLTALPISSWSYIGDAPGIRHVGPMAQGFRAAFGLGSSDRRIDGVDASGVLMLSIQALHEKLATLHQGTAALRRDNAALRRELKRLRNRIASRDKRSAVE